MTARRAATVANLWLHLAWGKQPLCGAIDKPLTLDPNRVTCPRCKERWAAAKGCSL